MLAEDGAQLTLLRLIAATEQSSLSGAHGLAQITVTLVLQEQIDGSVADAEDILEHTAFKIVQSISTPNCLVNLVSEAICQVHEDFSLVNPVRRCDDHATASMRVVLDYTHKHDKEADFRLAQFTHSSESHLREDGYTPGPTH
jgi:hypothetical protein